MNDHVVDGEELKKFLQKEYDFQITISELMNTNMTEPIKVGKFYRVLFKGALDVIYFSLSESDGNWVKGLVVESDDYEYTKFSIHQHLPNNIHYTEPVECKPEWLNIKRLGKILINK